MVASPSKEIKARARALVAKAVRDGQLMRPRACSRCGKPNVRIEGHHADYFKALEVEWLCVTCHTHTHHPNPHSRMGRAFATRLPSRLLARVRRFAHKHKRPLQVVFLELLLESPTLQKELKVKR